MKKIKKYSKSFKDVINIKKSFFTQNEEKLSSLKNINELYKQQPRRHNCKNCLDSIGDVDLVSFGVEYSLCDNCGHLNGIYEDTEHFAEKIYIDSEFEYYQNYTENPDDFHDRVNNIFIPKIDFLNDIMTEIGEGDFEICDIGCGAGHSVYAANMRGIKTEGYEVSKKMCEFGNKQIKKRLINNVNMGDVYDIVLATSADVVSLYGVLEHLCYPHKFLHNFIKSRATYLYINIPLFSVGTFIENVFPNVMPRQLSGAHTHLWTEESLEYLFDKHDLEPIGTWWFGTDFLDLYRSFLVELRKNNTSPKMIEKYNVFYNNLIDTFQATVDKNHTCSEVHIVLKKRRYNNEI